MTLPRPPADTPPVRSSGTRPLPELDRRIVAALQLRPRAAWSAIAAALGEPPRSVARRGTELLASGTVRVVGVRGSSRTALVRARTVVNTTRSVLTALAQREDCVFAYALTGMWPVLAELRADDVELPAVALDEVPMIPGIADADVRRVTRVMRSVREWIPDVLEPAVQEAVGRTLLPELYPGDVAPDAELSPENRLLLRILAEDGRTSTAELAARTRLSENTVRKRLQWLEAHHFSRIRVVVEPAQLGYPVEAVVHLQAHPDQAGAVIDAVLGHSEARYFVALGSDDALLVQFACRSTTHLHRLLSDAPWRHGVRSVDVAHVLDAPRRSGALVHRSPRERQLY